MILVEGLNLIARTRVDFLVFEVGAAGIVTLIVFVIKRFVEIGGLVVGLVRENSASRVRFLGLLAKLGLLECKTTFERFVGFVIRCLYVVAVCHMCVL